MATPELEYWIGHLFAELNYRFIAVNDDETIMENVIQYKQFREIILKSCGIVKKPRHLLFRSDIR